MTNFVPKEELASLGVDAIPVERYADPAYFERERETIFRRTWLCVGREMDVSTPTDFIVRNVEVCNASVIITRGRDNQLRAFHNVCSHRMASLVKETSGRSPVFVCRYHGWMYGMKGELRNVPDEKSFWSVDKAKCGLTPVSLGTSNGFIFINLDPEPRQTLKEFLGGMEEKLSRYDMASQDLIHYRFEADVPCNWKCVIDNFQETYHIGFIHSRSIGDRGVGPENPFSQPTHFDFVGPHRVVGVWGSGVSNQGKVAKVAIARAVKAMRENNELGARRNNYHPNWVMDVNTLFPNILIDLSHNRMLTHEVMPISVDRSRLTTTLYFPRPKTPGERIAHEYFAVLGRDTAVDDFGILRTIQDGFKSGAKTEVHFQAGEAACRHLANTVDEYVREGVPA